MAALRLFGFWNAGTPLEIASTPVSAAQPDENARSSRNAVAMPAIASWSGSGMSCELCTLGQAQAPRHCLDDADDAHPHDAEDERIHRDGEGLAGLANPAQVHRREEDDETDGDLDLVTAQGRDGGGGVLDAGRDGDRDREDVVDEQGAGDGEAGLRTEVDRGHLVVAAAARVGVDVLPVRRDDDDHDEDDGERDLPGVGDDEGAAGQAQHEEDLVGRIRHGRERVAGEDREGETLREERVAEPVAPHRPAEDETLEDAPGVRHAATV